MIGLKNAIRSDGRNVEARLDLATIYLRAGDGVTAEKELKAARVRGMDPNRILLPLTQAYALQNKNREILSELDASDWPLTLKPGVFAARGGAYLALGDLDAAERELSAAVEAAPDSIAVLLGLSKVLQAKGNLEAARQQADKALAIEPENERALIQTGSLLQATKDFDGAIETFSKALAVNPRSILARVARAGAYISANNDIAARADTDAALALMPKYPTARYFSALLLAREKRYAEADDELQPVMRQLGDHPPALYLQASLSLANGNLEQAQTQARGYLSKAPDSARGKRLLATIFLRKKAAVHAIDILEPMLEAAPDEMLNWTLLGEAYVAERRYEKAAVLFEKLVRLDPDNTEFRTRHALSQLNAGDHESAVKEFEALIATDPDNERANLLLMLTHLRKRDFKEALAAAQALKERMPDNPVADNFLGIIYLRKNQPDDARRHFELAMKTDPTFSPALLNLAELDRADGNLAAARARYEDILGRDRSHEQAMLRMAQISFAEYRDSEGMEWLRRAIAANPKATRPRVSMVNALLRNDRSEKALTVARELQQIDNADPEALDAVARTQIATGNLASGIATYRQLAALAPESAIVQYRFGKALAAGENYAEAAISLDKAIALDPEFDEAIEDRVRVAYLDGGAEQALAIALKYTDSAPQSDLGYRLQGDVHMHTGNYAAAAAAYAMAQENRRSGQTLRRQYQSYVRAGKVEDARVLLQSWLEDNPDDTSVRFLYAGILSSSGDRNAAIRENEKLLTWFPDNSGLLNDLAWLYGETDTKRAMEYAKRAYELAPNSPAIAGTLGSLLVRTGDPDGALELLRKAHAHAPNQHQVGFYYAVALAKSGEREEARQVLKNILDSGGKFNAIEEARTLYANLLAEAGPQR